MEQYQYSHSPQRKRSFPDGIIEKSLIKQRLDAFIENDFTILRKGQQTSLQELQLKYQNPLVLEYVRSIYDEYHITDPLNGNTSFTRVTMTPSGKKTSKKQKMHLMSSQTIKYSSPSQLKASRRPEQVSQDFDLVQDESAFIRKEFQNNTTIRASMSYFDVGQQLKDQSNSFGDLRTKINTLENQHEHSFFRLRQQSKNGLSMVVQEEVRPILLETDQNQGFLPRIRLPQISQVSQSVRDENKLYLAEIPSIRKPTGKRRQESGYVDESFRYCVGCERPLLHANIKHHQNSCKEFQLVFQMSAEEIVEYLKRKIKNCEENIKKASIELLSEDTAQLQESSMRMMQESRAISQQGKITSNFEQQYFKVIDIGKRWCIITEQINKVNWFLKIRQRIKQEFQL